jgi:amino acid transporter
MFNQLFATKSLSQLQADSERGGGLKRALGPIGLSSIGIGAIIGAGIFVITGRVAAVDAGPSILLSFLVAGFACTLAALCYAEFASMAPVAGSAYTYSYATLGEIFAWIIGWDLILEYAMSAATVSAVWGKYVNKLLKEIGHLGGFGDKYIIPENLCSDPFSTTGAFFNLPAIVIMLIITGIVLVGIRESAFTNTLLVIIKLVVVLFVIVLGFGFINTQNYTGIPVTDRILPGQSLIKEQAAQVEKYEEDLFKIADEWSKVVYGTTDGKPNLPAAQLLLKKLNDTTTTTLDRSTEKFEARRDRLAEQTLAAFKIAEATKQNDEALLAKTKELYEANLPTSERDKKVVAGLLAELDELAKKEKTKKWGMLGFLGIDKSLEKIDDSTRNPFMPYGMSGIMLGAVLVFFAYIGFDAVSTHAEEAKNPQRDMPVGILASLFVCTILYILVAAVITGMQPYHSIDQNAAIADAFSKKGIETKNPLLNASAMLIALGGLAGMTSVLLITFQSQSRIFMAMARDGLLPHSVFGVIHPVYQTPHRATLITGVAIALIAGFTPIGVLEEMVNIGTLLAFAIVCGSVLMLRVTQPNANRPFKCPLLFIVAPLGILVNVLLMLFLPYDTWVRLVVWLAIGLVIYFAFGMRNSALRQTSPAVS